MSKTTFIEMSPGERALEVEDYRRLLRQAIVERGGQATQDRLLSRTATGWLRRLQTALVDTDCTDRSYREMDAAAFASIPADEADELRRRLDEFAIIRGFFPMNAHDAEEAWPAINQQLGRAFDAILEAATE